MHHVQTAYVLMIAALIDKVRARTSKYMCGWIYVCLNTMWALTWKHWRVSGGALQHVHRPDSWINIIAWDRSMHPVYLKQAISGQSCIKMQKKDPVENLWNRLTVFWQGLTVFWRGLTVFSRGLTVFWQGHFSGWILQTVRKEKLNRDRAFMLDWSNFGLEMNHISLRFSAIHYKYLTRFK